MGFFGKIIDAFPEWGRGFFGGRIKWMYPQGNPTTIQNWINWLNTNFGQGWSALDGFHQLVLSGDFTKGIPVKAFWNMNTGEIKIFDARKFQ
jgi:hypothetical protein